MNNNYTVISYYWHFKAREVAFWSAVYKTNTD